MEPAENPHQQQRHQLEHGEEVLHHREGGDAAQVDEGAEPDRADRRGDHQHRIGERRDEHPQIADQGHRDGRVADPRCLPVGPRAQVAGKGAEAVAGVGIRPAGTGIQPRQAGEGEGQQHRAGGGDQPAEQAQAAKGRQAGRQQEHAGTDHVADHQGRAAPEPHAALLGCALLRHRFPLAHGVIIPLCTQRYSSDRSRRPAPAGRARRNRSRGTCARSSGRRPGSRGSPGSPR
ncbi:hypothetical protein D3C76_937400 [compost metagenome]